MSHYKYTTQPLCRCCGNKIAKITNCLWFNRRETRSLGDYTHLRAESPRSKAEVQQITNQTVLSVSYSGGGENRYVYKATTWDGASYKDRFFCTDNCAKRFAYQCVEGA